MATTDTLTYVVTNEEGAEKSYIHYTFSDGTVISRVSSRNAKGKMVSRWMSGGAKITAETARKVIESAVEKVQVTDAYGEDAYTYTVTDTVTEEDAPDVDNFGFPNEDLQEEESAALAVLAERHPVADNPRPTEDEGIFYSDIHFSRAQVAGIFWDQFGKLAAKRLVAEKHLDVGVEFDNSAKVITFLGTDGDAVHAAAEDLLEMFDAAKEVHKAWKKSDEAYKALEQGTKEGRQGAYRLTRDFWAGYVQQSLSDDLI